MALSSLSFTTTTQTPKTFHFKKPAKPHKKLLKAHLPIPHSDPTTLYKSYFHSISSLCKQGRLQAAFDLLTDMDLESFLISPEIYGELLQGCVYQRALFTGRQIHARIVKNGGLYARNEYVETKLLIFYSKCDLFYCASGLFRRLRVKNVFSWAAVVGLCCRMGFNEKALMGFCEMIESGILGDNFVVPNVLKACGALNWIGFGRGVHGYVTKLGLDSCVFVSSSLVDMYAKCGVLEDSRKVFDNISERNVVTWNAMIVGYLQNGFNQEAIQMFHDMRIEGNAEPSRVTLVSFLSASANLCAIEEGKQGHAIAVLGGFELDNILGSSILNYYCKVGLIEDAELVFNRMLEKDVVAWNLLISSYVHSDQAEKALDVCRLMRLDDMRFDSVTLASILSACAKTRNIELGRQGHCYCIRNNLESDVRVASSIIDMYAKCERIGDARRVFNSTTNRDLILWNTILAACGELGLAGETVKLFYQMQLESVPPNAISWNAVILGFLRNGLVNEAKDMFSQMQASGVHFNPITLNTVLSGLVQNGLENEALNNIPLWSGLEWSGK